MKGKKPSILQKLFLPIPTVYCNKGCDEPKDLAGACCCCCFYTLLCWDEDEHKGDLSLDGKAACPVNPGADPGCLCKCFFPPYAVHYNEPEHTCHQLIALLFTGCYYSGWCYTQFCWTPEVDHNASDSEEEAEQEMM
jgi:hypothetical protein